MPVDQNHVPAPVEVMQVDMQALIKALLMQKGEFLSDYDAMYEACFRLQNDDKKYFDDFYETFKEKNPNDILFIVDHLEKEDVWSSEEWSMPASVKTSHKLKIREHVVKCLEYIAYKEVLFESYNSLCITYFGVDLNRVERVFKAMLTLHKKASQHVAAIHVLKNHEQKSYDFRAQKGGFNKSLKLKGKELEVLYVNMVKHLILVDPPNNNENMAIVADRYTKRLLSLNEEFNFFPSEKPDAVFQSVLDALNKFKIDKSSNHKLYFERIKKRNLFSFSKDRQPATLSEHSFYKAGICQGLLFSVEMMVSQEFGEITEKYSDKLKTATYHELLACLNSLKDAEKMSDVFRHM